MSVEILNNILDGCTTPNEGEHCVYSLLDDLNKVVYVGKTTRLKTRLYEHIMDGKGFLSFSYAVCDAGNATKLERDEIIKHDPILNKSLPRTEKYKTIDQAKAIIKSEINERVMNAVNNLDVAFTRSAKHTYVKSDDIKTLLDELFTNQSERVS